MISLLLISCDDMKKAIHEEKVLAWNCQAQESRPIHTIDGVPKETNSPIKPFYKRTNQTKTQKN
jgi:hypothetical protein